MDPLGMVIAVILGAMLIGGFAQASAPQEPQVIYVRLDRTEQRVEEQDSSGIGLILFFVVVGLAIYFTR